MPNKITRRVATAVAAVAMLALAASPAHAAQANWSTTASGLKFSGTLTVKKNGGSAKTCTGTTGYGAAYAAGGFYATNAMFYRLACAGGGFLDVNAVGYADHSAGAFSLMFDYSSGATSPWSGGVWYQDPFQVPFTNATGGNPSKITFNDTPIGVTSSLENVTATGTLNVTTSTGGTLTLNQ